MPHEPTLNEKEQEYLKLRVNSEEIIHRTTLIGKETLHPEVKVVDYSEQGFERALKPASFEKLVSWLKEKNEEHLR